jgi:hypothetical protein
MTDPNQPLPESEDDALNDVESLGGDDSIMESLPPEGSPISAETEYDEIDGSGVLDDGAAHDYSSDAPEPLDALPYADDAEAEPGADAYDAYAYPPDDDLSDIYAARAAQTDEDPYAYLDIEAALASVATLGEAEAQREQAEIAQQVAAAAVQEAQEERRRLPRRVAVPPPLVMRRGQLASVVPALVLMALGGWLTFAMTVPDAVPLNPLLVVLAVGAALVVTLLAFWLASGRWSRGALFFALLLVLTAGALYYQTTLTLGYSITGPLVLSAAGLAFALTGLFSKPTESRLLIPAILLLAAAAVNLAVTIGYLPAGLLTGAAAYWPVLVAVVVVLWLLPVLLRRRS